MTMIPEHPIRIGPMILQFIMLTAFFAACLGLLAWAPEIDAAISGWKAGL